MVSLTAASRGGRHVFLQELLTGEAVLLQTCSFRNRISLLELSPTFPLHVNI